MTANRLVQRLDAARTSGTPRLLPYITAGYPSLDVTMQLLHRFNAAGCPAVEIGFPFSDSIADGPVIQDSFYRALDSGFRVPDLFERISAERASLETALLAMVSLSIVRRFGLEAFAQRAAESGFDGLIVPDVPVDESAQLSQAATTAGLCSVLMCAPTSPETRQQHIAEHASGFIYLIAAKGITGERGRLADDLLTNVARLKNVTTTPVVVGFGISTPEQVREVCSAADGVIIGSAIISRIRAALEAGRPHEDIVKEVGDYVDELSAASVPAT